MNIFQVRKETDFITKPLFIKNSIFYIFNFHIDFVRDLLSFFQSGQMESHLGLLYKNIFTIISKLYI